MRPATAAPGLAARGTVLVVEDEALIRMVLAEECVECGLDVVEAGDADAAVRLLAGGKRVDVVVTDVRMPGTMDGLGLCRWLREHAPSVPIVVTSGYAQPHNLASINPAIAQVIGKPYKAGEVADIVRDLLRVRGG